MSETVYVTNKSDNNLVVNYAYNKVEFPVGKPVEVPLALAQFIFGHGVTDKEACLVRLGWVSLHSELEQGLERLSKFAISDKPLIEEDSSLPSAVGVVPLHVEKRAGGGNRQRVA